MTKIELKCEGLACPQPVLKCKEAIEAHAPQELCIYVDNPAACENVLRFLQSQGYEAEHSIVADCYTIIGKKIGTSSPPKTTHHVVEHPTTQQAICVVISADVFGAGDPSLGEKLMLNFLGTLPEMGEELWRIVLLNSGVRLTIEESPALVALQKLESQGVSILVCGTCLEFYGILDKKKVGETTNMLDVVTSLEHASKVITI